MQNYNILNKIKDIKTICILGHLDPDADALSSMVVLKNFLKSQLNTEIDLFASCNDVTKNCKHIIKNENFNITPKSKYDLAIAVDSTTPERLDKYQNLFKQANSTIVIDHHSTNPKFGDLNIIEPTSSTCEIIYKILEYNNYKFTTQDYEFLYSGIITDTGNFTNPSTNKETHDIAGKICKHINISKIYNNFFSNFSLVNMKLFACAINNIKSYENNKIIISHITQSFLDEQNASNNDLTGIVNRLTQINNNILTCFIQPKGNNLNYVSLRAKNGYDISTIAKKYGGGGHIGASGFTSSLTQDEIIKHIKSDFFDILKSNNK